MPKHPGPAPRATKASLKLAAPIPNGVQPQPAQRPAEPPVWLSGPQLDIWHRVVAEMSSAGLGALAIDTDLICAYCVTADLVATTAYQVSQAGPTLKSANGNMVRHPAAGILLQSVRVLDALSTALGLSPDARARMRILPADTEAAQASTNIGAALFG